MTASSTALVRTFLSLHAARLCGGGVGTLGAGVSICNSEGKKELNKVMDEGTDPRDVPGM